jgi:hypothetical protein
LSAPGYGGANRGAVVPLTWACNHCPVEPLIKPAAVPAPLTPRNSDSPLSEPLYRELTQINARQTSFRSF